MTGDLRLTRRMLASLGAVALLGGAAVGHAAGALPALSRLEPGLWQVRELGTGSPKPPVRLCIADTAMLTQLQHRSAPCSRTVIASDTNSATVHYTCPAHGFGRTSVRVETPRLAKIDTQGIMDNAPFAFRAEARHLGSCPKANAGR